MAYKALRIPPEVDKADCLEIVRAALVGEGLHVSLRLPFKEHEIWGEVLADIARQVAGAYAHDGLAKAEDVIAKIRESFNADIEKPVEAGGIAPIT